MNLLNDFFILSSFKLFFEDVSQLMIGCNNLAKVPFLLQERSIKLLQLFVLLEHKSQLTQADLKHPLLILAVFYQDGVIFQQDFEKQLEILLRKEIFQMKMKGFNVFRGLEVPQVFEEPNKLLD